MSSDIGSLDMEESLHSNHADEVISDELPVIENIEKRQQSTLSDSAVFDWKKFFSAPVEGEQIFIQKEIKRLAEPASIDDRFTLATNQLLIGDFVQSRANFIEILRQDENHLEALLGVATVALQTGRLKNAFALLARLKKQIESAENSDKGIVFRYRFVLSLAYLHYKDMAKSRKILGDLIRIDPTFAPGYAALASSYIARKKLVMADFILSRGMDKAGEYPAFLNLHGLIAQHRKMPARAHSFYGRALQIQPSHVGTLINQAHLYIDQVDYDQAERHIAKVLSWQPLNVEALMLLGILEGLQGDYAAATAALQKAVEVAPHSPEARYNLGLMTMYVGDQSAKVMRLLNEVKQMSEPTTKLYEQVEDLISVIDRNRDIL